MSPDVGDAAGCDRTMRSRTLRHSAASHNFSFLDASKQAKQRFEWHADGRYQRLRLCHVSLLDDNLQGAAAAASDE